MATTKVSDCFISINGHITPITKVNYMIIKPLGVSENSVPLNPMVNDHYPVLKWLFHWED